MDDPNGFNNLNFAPPTQTETQGAGGGGRNGDITALGAEDEDRNSVLRKGAVLASAVKNKPGSEPIDARLISLSKFLSPIGESTDGPSRHLSNEAASELRTLLGLFEQEAEILGTVILGRDGLLVANTLPNDLDAEAIGVWALGVYLNSEHVCRKMSIGRLHQIVSWTPCGTLVIADFGGGLLVTLSSTWSTKTARILVP